MTERFSLLNLIVALVASTSLKTITSAFAPSIAMRNDVRGVSTTPATLNSITRVLMAQSSETNMDYSDMKLPKLIVFDLDNTLWTPELYQLRKLQRAKATPKAGKDVKLFPGSQKILQEHIPALQQQGVQFAVASRTKSVEWAHALLGQFGLKEVFSFIEIFPGNKKRHFTNLKQASGGLDYSSMLFFDDARDGKYGNCEPVADMGVLSVHCPGGLTTQDIFTNALQKFQEWDRTPGTIVEWDGSMSVGAASAVPAGGRQEGTVKKINREKRYGFIRYRNGSSRDLFFHFSSLVGIPDESIEEGDQVSFVRTKDPKNGKFMAADVELGASVNKTQAEFKCFTMNQPFAALLANGYKNLETRNGTMFTPYAPGTIMLLHVGRRTYPDGDKHLQVMASGGLDEEEIRKLKSLPDGFGRGSIVAILELGRTYETTLQERSDPAFQRRVAAYGADSGRIVTEIKRAEYLKRPIKMPGQPGVFKVRIDPEVLPDGWDKTAVPEQEESASSLYATISG